MKIECNSAFDINAQVLQARLKKFAINSVYLFKSLPREEEAKIIGKQFLRSALSSAANYRAACKAQTKKSFVAKLSIAFEESDESVFWLEIMRMQELFLYRNSQKFFQKQKNSQQF